MKQEEDQVHDETRTDTVNQPSEQKVSTVKLESSGQIESLVNDAQKRQENTVINKELERLP